MVLVVAPPKILLGLLFLWNYQMISVPSNKYHKHHFCVCFLNDLSVFGVF